MEEAMKRWKWLRSWRAGLLLVWAGLLLAGIQDRTDGEPMPPTIPRDAGSGSAATAQAGVNS
jgi:hypothetical protein